MKELFKEIMENPFLSSSMVFLSQLVFIYLRTLNVIYTSDKKMIPAIITGNGIGLSILVSYTISMDSLRNGEMVPIILFLLGGTLGTYWGIKQNIKNEKK